MTLGSVEFCVHCVGQEISGEVIHKIRFNSWALLGGVTTLIRTVANYRIEIWVHVAFGRVFIFTFSARTTPETSQNVFRMSSKA